MAIVSAEVRFAPQLTAWFTANPTKVLQDGEIVYCSDGANIGKYVIGDNSAQLSTLTFYGGISSSGLTIGTTTITSGTNTRILYNNAGVVGEYLVTGTGTTAVLSTSPTFTTSISVTGSSVGQLSNVFTNTNASGIVSIYTQPNNVLDFGGIFSTGDTYTPSGLILARTSALTLTSVQSLIYNGNSSGNIIFGVGLASSTAIEAMRISSTKNISISGSGSTKQTSPTAYLHLAAGESGANKAPLKLTAGTDLTTAETGAFEYDGTNLHFTPTGTTRRTISYLDDDLFTTTHFHSNSFGGGMSNVTYHFDKSLVGVTVASSGTGITYIPYDCTLVGFTINSYVAGTLGTTENVSIYVRVNDTSDITLTSTHKYSAQRNTSNSSAINTNINSGSYIEIKIIAPIMATPPTSITQSVTLFLKRR